MTSLADTFAEADRIAKRATTLADCTYDRSDPNWMRAVIAGCCPRPNPTTKKEGAHVE